jgi:hypothetical protein
MISVPSHITHLVQVPWLSCQRKQISPFGCLCLPRTCHNDVQGLREKVKEFDGASQKRICPDSNIPVENRWGHIVQHAIKKYLKSMFEVDQLVVA